MRRRNHPLLGSQKGTESVEFALVLLPLFAFVFLIINIAWLIFARACLQEAVRQGVRYAITGQTLSGMGLDASVQTAVQQDSFGFIPAANAGCVSVQFFSPSDLSTPLTGSGSDAPGNVVKVSIGNFSVRPLSALLINSAPIPLTASSSDIMQGGPGGLPPSRGTALTCPPSS
jgi:hypothetical protein